MSWHVRTMTGAIALVLAVSAPSPHGLAEDPWPEWQRTPSRLGRTSTTGPQTATIEWRLRIDFTGFPSGLSCSPSLDESGRLYVGTHNTVVCVDTMARDILWEFPVGDGVSYTPSLWQDRVLFGSADDFFYCVRKNTGQELWSVPAVPHPNRGNVVDAKGVVYYGSQQDMLYARWVEDGSEVWTHNHGDGFNAAPALDGLGQLYIGNASFGEWLAFESDDADIVWTFPIGSIPAGTSPVENGRVYVPSVGGRALFCLDAQTGQEVWSFDTESLAVGAAIRPDGVIYVTATGGAGSWLFAVSPDGEELWRYPLGDEGMNRPPIADGAANAYFCGYGGGGILGRVYAFQPDGTPLWVKQMPDKVSASPMLAPDGTLYVVCKDKYLYAFHDPPNLEKTDAGDHKQATDVRPVPPP